ncbi:MAG: 3,4-dihydroxy-2-butanone-4-phosphate synthase [Bdellovibrionota bacterium]|nr:MAG: 3,4-dihydroxy-2-butanone-4-phosphate synthase [Bdellovibrionota bacterium]
MTNWFTEFQKFHQSFLRRGLAVLVDQEARTPRAVVLTPGDHVTAATLNELLSLTGGIPFVAIPEAQANGLMLLELPARLSHNAREATRSFVSVEAREGVSTGISAEDRARTIQILAESPPQPRKLVRPGHVFPVAVVEGGTLVRNALPEGAFDLGVLCASAHAVVFSDLLDAKGEIPSLDAMHAFCNQHQLPAITLSQLVAHRLEAEQLVYRVSDARIPTSTGGDLRAVVYRSRVYDGEHVALIKGDISGSDPVLTRVQREHTLTDVFSGTLSKSREHLHFALREIGRVGRGVVVYLRSNDFGALASGAGSALGDRAALMRGYGIGAQILRDLGVTRVRLLTGSPKRLAGLKSFGIDIVEQLELPRDLSALTNGPPE